jgi:VanZ family protein
MGVIFGLSHQPGTGIDWEPPLWYVVERKSAHIFEYALLMFLAFGFLRSVYQMASKRALLSVAFVFCVTYGVLDELHQFFIFGRGARFTDVVFDALGALAMTLFLWLWYRYQNQLRSSI